jgi:hypothetical protein
MLEGTASETRKMSSCRQLLAKVLALDSDSSQEDVRVDRKLRVGLKQLQNAGIVYSSTHMLIAALRSSCRWTKSA